MLSNILFPCRNYDCLCLHFSSTSVKSFCDQTRSSILFQLITFTDRGFFNCNSSCHHRDKKKVPVGKKVYSGAAAAIVLMYNLPFYYLSKTGHKKFCPSSASPQLLNSSITLVKKRKRKLRKR